MLSMDPWYSGSSRLGKRRSFDATLCRVTCALTLTAMIPANCAELACAAPIPGHIKAWAPNIRRATECPEGYAGEINTSDMYIITDSGHPDGIVVTQRPCDICQIARDPCNRAFPRCSRCIRKGRDCTYPGSYVRFRFSAKRRPKKAAKGNKDAEGTVISTTSSNNDSLLKRTLRNSAASHQQTIPASCEPPAHAPTKRKLVADSSDGPTAKRSREEVEEEEEEETTPLPAKTLQMRESYTKLSLSSPLLISTFTTARHPVGWSFVKVPKLRERARTRINRNPYIWAQVMHIGLYISYMHSHPKRETENRRYIRHLSYSGETCNEIELTVRSAADHPPRGLHVARREVERRC